MTWKDVFDIEDHTGNSPYYEMAWNDPNRTPYHLKLLSTGQVIAKYEDFVYAQKQAKRKFRRMMRKAEREILGQ